MSEVNAPFQIFKPKITKAPFLLSIPHCGTSFPNEIKDNYNANLISSPDDTDWYLETLYDFAEELGVTVIKAVYSRWVIDLNRTPQNQSLYNDGRIITSLCPTTTFLGEKLYKKDAYQPNSLEIERRLENYYWPYHHKIDALIDELKSEFGQVVFWDAHSIRRNVQTIQRDNFPDLILGNNDQKTASQPIIDLCLKSLGSQNFELKHNTPFKGGYITRSKGEPEANIHALQLEMCKDLYMSNKEMTYDAKKAVEIKSLLKTTFQNLITHLNE
ncbi:MAG: N-formylglutamate amidohydrolase [Crocinitomicaceae bacterium]|jgi:N-formylglutamate deformylase|tara:strand:- start:7760 stop:8575 length:816 start_codon:yes stop_codon:yes gene_type:complete